MSTPQIVAHSRWSKGGQGEYPVRYVILRWSPKESAHEFSRHMQVKDGKHDNYFIYGHFFTLFDGAMNDMIRSIKENNRDYPYGNVSHIPGGVSGITTSNTKPTRKKSAKKKATSKKNTPANFGGIKIKRIF